MAPTKVLLIGVTGYIGGSILTALKNSQDPNLKTVEFSATVREKGGDASRAEALKKIGVTPISLDSLDDTETLRKAAADHDIVINAASAFHTLSAKALLEGLAERKKAGKSVLYLHQSGTSSVGDKPISQPSAATANPPTLSDKTSDVAGHLRTLEADAPYPQRTTDVAVLSAAKELGVPSYIVMSPTIYGPGLGPSGLSNPSSIQIPALIKAAIERKQAVSVGEGDGRWNFVSIADLADLWERLVSALLARKDLPEGEKGIYFTDAGVFRWKDLSSLIAKAGADLGALETAEVKPLGPDEELVPGWPAPVVELGFASNALTQGELARELLGWEPKDRQEAWEKEVKAEFERLLEKTKQK